MRHVVSGCAVHIEPIFANSNAKRAPVLHKFLGMLRLINPRMGLRFSASFAFLRPPRLTLNEVMWSTAKPPRLMLGGGAERGSGRGGEHKVRQKGQSLVPGLRGHEGEDEGEGRE